MGGITCWTNLLDSYVSGMAVSVTSLLIANTLRSLERNHKEGVKARKRFYKRLKKLEKELEIIEKEIETIP